MKLVNTSPNALFMPASTDKDTGSSLTAYIAWLDTQRLMWWNADLVDYLAYLKSRNLTLGTVKKHMERVRGRYRDLLNSNAVRDLIQSQIPVSASPADAFAITEEFLTRLRNNTQYSKALAVKLPVIASYVDSDFTWLTREQVQGIFDRIPDNQIGRRDAAIFGLALSYGLREFEICAATVQNLHEKSDGKSGILIEHGKGDKRRFVQFDGVMDYTAYIYRYLTAEDIRSGRIINLTTRQLQNRVALYTGATAHDLRRTYARLAYLSGRSVEFIRQQLGHAKVETTLDYIGALNE